MLSFLFGHFCNLSPAATAAAVDVVVARTVAAARAAVASEQSALTR